LNVELPNGLKGASLIQHSTFNTQHSLYRPAIDNWLAALIMLHVEPSIA
jgi:hypothetical protein